VVVGEPGKAAGEEKPAADEKPAEKSAKGASKGDKGRGKGRGEGKKSGDAVAGDSKSKSGGDKAKAGREKDARDILSEFGKKEEPAKPAAPPQPKLVTLTQSDIVNAMKGVQPKVQACANQYKVPGTAMANISVASGGKVSNATVTGKFAATPTASCVETAAKSAKFPACQGMNFPWPFTLSPR
jgi:ribosomal protein L15